MGSGGDSSQDVPIQKTKGVVYNFLGLLQPAVSRLLPNPLPGCKSTSTGLLPPSILFAESSHSYHVWQRTEYSAALRSAHW